MSERQEFTCCICGKEFIGWGNNPNPVDMQPGHRCCNDCNAEYVIPARLANMYNEEEKK